MTSCRLSRLLAGGLCVVLALSACVESDISAGDVGLSDWVAAESIPLDSLTWSPAGPMGYGVLDSDLEDVEVVYLGEPDHYIEEKYDYRLGLIRYLVGQGFTHIGMEMGYSDGLRIDEYLATGDPSRLDRVALYGHRDEYTLPLPQILEAELSRPYRNSFVNEERGFLSQLLEMSTSLPGDQRLHWFGFDVDIVPGGGYADALHILDSVESNADLLVHLRDSLIGSIDLPSAERVAPLENLEELIAAQQPELGQILGVDKANTLNQTIQNLADSYRFQTGAFAEPFGSGWLDAVKRREQDLIERLEDGWLPSLPEGAKIILLGHNLHLNKRVEDLKSGPLDDPSSTPMWPTIGSALAQHRKVYAIWMLYEHGSTQSAFIPESYATVDSDPTRIEHILTKIGSLYFLPLTNPHPDLTQPVNFNQNGATASGILTQVADALVFTEQAHAIHD